MVSIASGGRVAIGHVGSLTPLTVVGARSAEWVRANTHPPKMTISAQNATSANLRRDESGSAATIGGFVSELVALF
jgi:hypothetical protein